MRVFTVVVGTSVYFVSVSLQHIKHQLKLIEALLNKRRVINTL